MKKSTFHVRAIEAPQSILALFARKSRYLTVRQRAYLLKAGGRSGMNPIMMFTCLNLATPCAVTGASGMPFFNPAMEELIDSPSALELFLAQV